MQKTKARLRSRHAFKRVVLSCEVLELRQLLAGVLIDHVQGELPVDGGDLIAPDAGPLKIVGGERSDADAYPWMVSMQLGGDHDCGAALVAPDTLLTAAHCVTEKLAENYTIVVGRNDLRSNTGEEIAASQLIVHPNYNPDTDDSDLAVVWLADASAIEPLAYHRPSQPELTEPGRDVIAMGWGSRSEGGDGTNQLQEVTVPIVANRVANRPEFYSGEITDNMLAAGVPGKDSCQGDSGGPLVADDNGSLVVVGITSWGEGCGRFNRPGIYTRVSQFTDWIDNLVQVLPHGTVGFSQPQFASGADIEILLQDSDLEEAATVDVEVTTAFGDTETLQLTALGRGRFRGQINFSEASPTAHNAILEGRDGETIRVTYQDADIGDGTSANASDVATVIGDDFSNDAEGALLLSNPTTVNGELEIARDVDWFQFEAEVGKVYQIEVRLEGTLVDSILDLFDDDGRTVLDTNDDFGAGFGSKITHVAQTSGTKYIQVSGFEASIGTYELLFREAGNEADDFGNSPDTATPISFGQTISGRIDFDADVDWFSFNSTPGQVVTATVDLVTLPDSFLQLIDSNGMSVLEENDDVSITDLSSAITWTAASDGTKFLRVAGFTSETGSYRVTLRSSTPIDPQRLVIPAETSGNVGPSDDWYVFEANENSTYIIETSLGTLVDSALVLIDTDESTVLTIDEDSGIGQGSKIIWRAPSAGDRFLQVLGVDGASGDYHLSIVELVDDYGNTAANAFEVALPQTLSAQIETIGDVDWFAVDVMQGQSYTFETRLLELSDTILRLIGPDGTSELTRNDDIAVGQRASRIEWEADRTGTVYLEVAGFRSQVGTYEIEFVGDTPADDHGNTSFDATPLSLDVAESARIESRSDADWFSFTTTAGLAYRLDVQGPSPRLDLIGSDGATVTQSASSNEDRATIVWLAAEDATLFAAVQSSSQLNGSIFEVSLTVPFGDSNLDGVFNSADLVTVFVQAEYEDDEEDNSSWADGDWNGDGDFTTADLVAAFVADTFVRASRPPSTSRDLDQLGAADLDRRAVGEVFQHLDDLGIGAGELRPVFRPFVA